MSTGTIRGPSSFGKRETSHTITVTRNGESRQFNINPVVFSICTCFAVMLIIGYLGATAYFVFRDDLLGAAYARQARMKHEYEDRIAALRSRLDHITSRQLLDQQAIENRVHELVKRQELIGSRGGKLGALMEKARERGISGSAASSATSAASGDMPAPSARPVRRGDPINPVQTGSSSPARGPVEGDFASILAPTGVQNPSRNLPAETVGNHFTNHLFAAVAKSIHQVEIRQKEQLDWMRLAANERSKTLERVLSGLGVRVKPGAANPVGGPYEPIEENTRFESYLEAFEVSLERYDQLSATAKGLPLAAPVKNPRVSSRFGHRIDPFNGKRAMHGGVDFKAPDGTLVYATGHGRVTFAGQKGGYGKLVEVRHQNGLVTRYAHLSRIHAKVGQSVATGERLGRVGSTGRSTGPHLHYEVRSGETATDPSPYLRAGEKVRGLI